MAKASAGELTPGPAPRGKTVLKAFEYQDVQLLPGMLLTQVEQARQLYSSISNDDILKGFRHEAGRLAPGDGMKGWCKSTSAVIFGQLISGMVRLGRATADGALIEKANALFEGWLETLPPDGNARMRAYDWDKLVCGLVDLGWYGGSNRAVAALRTTVEWASRTFDRTRQPADGHDFWGAGPSDTPEWYTLSENLYRAYLFFGDPLFKEFADIWLYHDYWRLFAETAAPHQVLPVHAYSHINSFSSAAAAYLVTGDECYRQICINGCDFTLKTQCYATGGYGPDERIMPPDGSLGRSLDVFGYHAEIPCGSWAAFKLSMYLMRFTGEARFGDWIETLVYNAMGATLPPEQDGKCFYYGDYRPSGGMKTHYWHEWPCCSGTYIQNMAEYYNMIYLRGESGLYVNLFVSSEVTFEQDGQSVTLRQETAYPEAETSTMRLKLKKPARLAIRFRVPGWSEGMSLAVNGSPLDVLAKPGGWASIDREWNSGDTVVITIPMALRTLPVDRQHPDRAAIVYGPVVLAQDEACCRRPFSIASTTELNTRLIREGEGLRFRMTIPCPSGTCDISSHFILCPDFGPTGYTSTLLLRPFIKRSGTLAWTEGRPGFEFSRSVSPIPAVGLHSLLRCTRCCETGGVRIGPWRSGRPLC